MSLSVLKIVSLATIPVVGGYVFVSSGLGSFQTFISSQEESELLNLNSFSPVVPEEILSNAPTSQQKQSEVASFGEKAPTVKDELSKDVGDGVCRVYEILDPYDGKSRVGNSSRHNKDNWMQTMRNKNVDKALLEKVKCDSSRFFYFYRDKNNGGKWALRESSTDLW